MSFRELSISSFTAHVLLLGMIVCLRMPCSLFDDGDFGDHGVEVSSYP